MASYQLKSYLLALKHVKRSHTAINLLDELNGVIDSWGLSSKVISISADGAFNIKKAITDSNTYDYMNCLAHLLNLVVKMVFLDESIGPILAKCRQLVGTFKHSTSLSEKLSDALRKAHALYLDEEIDQREINETLELIESSDSTQKKTLKLKLVQDMATRWNSTLAMLISVFDAHSAIRYTLFILSELSVLILWHFLNEILFYLSMVISLYKHGKYSHELLTETELNIIEDFIALLKPFQELTVLISASKYVTSSIVLPAITRLMEVLHVYKSSHGFGFIDE